MTGDGWRDTLVADTNLTTRARNALIDAGLLTLGAVAEKSDGELLRLPNFGSTSLADVRAFIRPPKTMLIPRELSPERTLRDWFAGQALSSFAEHVSPFDGNSFDSVAGLIAKVAYLMADHMIAERTKKED
jgi:hypothetical protein